MMLRGGGFRPRALLLSVLVLVIVDAAALKAHAQFFLGPKINPQRWCFGTVCTIGGRRRLLQDCPCGSPPPHPPPHPPPAYHGRKLQGFNAKRRRDAIPTHNHHHPSREAERDRLLGSYYY